MGPGLHDTIGGVMKNAVIGLLLSMLSLVFADNEKILVFKDAIPYNGHLAAINACMTMLRGFGSANGFSIDTTVQLTSFNSDNLAKYDAVLMLYPYRQDPNNSNLWYNDTMTASEDSAFKSFLLSGKGFVGVHCYSRLNNNQSWFIKTFLGVQYANDIGPQNCTYHVADTNQPMTKGIPHTFTDNQQVRVDSIYFSETDKSYTVLIRADANDYPAGQKMSFYPYVFMHDYQGARMWGGAMGHTAATWSNANWRQLILNGILYAVNRSGYVKCANPIPRPVFLNTEGWTLDRNKIARIFDCSGRTIGAMAGNQLQKGPRFPRRARLPFGTYIVAPNSSHGSALPWVVPMR